MSEEEFIPLVENQDYALILPKDAENDQAWDIRILEGDYVETVIRFGNIAVAEGEDEGRLNFNFVIQYTPDNDLTEEDEGLQDLAGRILVSVISDAIDKDELVTDDGSKD